MRLAVLLTAFVSGLMAHALDFKPLQLHSGFNEPLHAVIDVVDVPRRGGLRVRFFDPGDPFREIRTADVFNQVALRVEVKQEGSTASVELTTRLPLQQARIDLIIQVADGRGNIARRRILRALPGTFTAGTHGGRHIDRSAQFLRRNKGRDYELGYSAPGDVVYTSDYNNLWTIAMETRAGYGVSVYQTMLAILNKNTKAFGRSGEVVRNVNYLQAGRELTIPTLREIRSVNRASAIVDVAEMNYLSQLGPIDPRALRRLVALEDVGKDIKEAVETVDLSRPIAPSAEEELPAWVAQQPQEVERPTARTRPSPEIERPQVEAPIRAPSLPRSAPSPEAPVAEESNLLIWILAGGVALLVLIVLVALRRRAVPAEGASFDEEGESADSDQVGEQLDLVQAYVEMQDFDAARTLVGRVLENPDITTDERARATQLSEALPPEQDS